VAPTGRTTKAEAAGLGLLRAGRVIVSPTAATAARSGTAVRWDAARWHRLPRWQRPVAANERQSDAPAGRAASPPAEFPAARPEMLNCPRSGGAPSAAGISFASPDAPPANESAAAGVAGLADADTPSTSSALNFDAGAPRGSACSSRSDGGCRARVTGEAGRAGLTRARWSTKQELHRLSVSGEPKKSHPFAHLLPGGAV
jgi:hypothetical protein